MTSVVLTLLALGVSDLVNFDFMDAPSPEMIMRALEILHFLGAMDGEGEITDLGRKMSELPLDCELSKILISSSEFQCSEEVLTLVAMLSV
jgi:pre-mRNA-splicing factor ATP-dependent RNA helicase DHX15/PRP43|mmetsp:Transcript_21323/g.3458  ORF Transcript_21323/g.3458 Transcript_21323/m.3458 type:complete len:91 (+) Transcript_21323:1208-1480(+)